MRMENQKPSEFIVCDPAILMGKPTIKGTRISVELILDKLAAGESVADVLRAHPHLTETQIRAAMGFAAQMLRSDAVYPLSPIHG